MVHDQFEVIEDRRGEVLTFIDGKAERAFFLMVEIVYLLLYGPEHLGLGAAWLHSKDRAQKMVEFPDTDCREADILHMPQVLVYAFGKTAQSEGFSHAGLCGKDADAPDIPYIGEA